MGWLTKNPQRVLGANPTSGGPNTGEQLTVRGGSLKGSIASGGLAPVVYGGPGVLSSGNQAYIYSGGGRLNSVCSHSVASGVAAFFYDAIAVTGSGVLVSGAAIIGVVPANSVQTPINIDVPFSSGLAVSAPSGCMGFTWTFTPDTTPNNAQ